MKASTAEKVLKFTTLVMQLTRVMTIGMGHIQRVREDASLREAVYAIKRKPTKK